MTTLKTKVQYFESIDYQNYLIIIKLIDFQNLNTYTKFGKKYPMGILG